MGLNLGEITAFLTLDASGFNKNVASAKGALGDIGKMLVGVSLAASAAGAAAVKLASDVVETQSLAVNAFGKEGAAAMEKWASASGEAMGRTSQQMRQAATSMQALLVPTLGATDATARMSKSLAQLSVDLGSAYNIADGDALLKLRSGLMGEMEPLKALGINMSVASLNLYALNQGFKGGVEAMTEAQKATLRYNYILQGTAMAHNDAVETAGSFANQAKALEAGVTELATKVGNVLLPAAQKMMDALLQGVGFLKSFSAETMRSGVEAAATAAKWAGMAGAAAIVAAKLLELGSAMREITVGGGLSSIMGNVKGIMASMGAVLALGAAIAGIVAIVLTLRMAWREMGDGLKETITGALSYVKDTLGSVLSAVADAPLKIVAKIMEAFADIAEKLGNTSLGKAAGLDMDPTQLAQLRETIAMLRKEHVDYKGPLADAGAAVMDAMKTSRDALGKEMKLMVNDLGKVLGVDGDLMKRLGTWFDDFKKRWEAADPAAKRAAAQGKMQAYAPEAVPDYVKPREFNYNQFDPDQYKIAQTVTGAFNTGIAQGLANVNWAGILSLATDRHVPLLMENLADAMPKGLQGVVGAIGDVVGNLGKVSVETFSMVGSVVTGIGKAFLDMAKAAIEGLVNWAKGIAGAFMSNDQRAGKAQGAASAGFGAVTAGGLGLIGPWAPLAALVGVAAAGVSVFVALITETKSFLQYQRALSRGFDYITQALEPFFRQLLPVAGIFIQLSRVLAQFMAALIPGPAFFHMVWRNAQALAVMIAGLVVVFLEVKTALYTFNAAIWEMANKATAGKDNFINKQAGESGGAADRARAGYDTALQAAKDLANMSFTSSAALATFADSVAAATAQFNIPNWYRVASAVYGAVGGTAANGRNGIVGADPGPAGASPDSNTWDGRKVAIEVVIQQDSNGTWTATKRQMESEGFRRSGYGAGLEAVNGVSRGRV